MTDSMTSAQFRAIASRMKGAKRIGEELSVHLAIVEYLHTVLPGHLGFHPANGEKRDIQTAKKLKRMGVRPGVPDFVIPISGGKVLWLEIKKPKGRASRVQKAFIDRLRAMQHPVAIVESVEDVKNTFRALGIVTRESRT